MNNAVAAVPVRTRLPVPAGVAPSLWRVLTEAIFPNAKSTDAIVLAMEYCRVRNLDILKKPVNIVPVWSSALRREVETVWPAITEAEVTAARTHEWAGLDKPVFGPSKTSTFKGRRKDDRGNWIDAAVTVTYPEWGEVTVYRMVCGVKCAFTETVHWEEAYGRQGGGALPNAIWTKRPFDQFAKVCKAASLRAAFPEEEGGNPTAEEMEGHAIDETVIEAMPAQADQGATSGERDSMAGGGGVQSTDDPGWTPPAQSDHDPRTGEVLDETTPEELTRDPDEDWREWGQRFIGRIRHAGTAELVDEWMKLNEKVLSELMAHSSKMHATLLSAVGRHRAGLEPQTKEGT